MTRHDADPGEARIEKDREEAAPREPVVGELVHDTAIDKVGEFRGSVGGRWMLRPPGGGTEWEADPAAVAPPGMYEHLRALVAVDGARRRDHRR